MRISTNRSLASLLCVWLVACGDDAASAPVSVSKLIGPEGGSLELADGPKITIPSGALSETTAIKITRLGLEDVADLPTHLTRAGKPFAFEPHGTTFSRAVKIELPFEAESDDEATSVRPMKLNDTEDTDWRTVFPSEKDGANKHVVFDVMGFSVYLAARPLRNSGVVVLPDGAIAADAGMDAMVDDAGMDAMVDDAGMDAMADDAGMDAAVALPGRIVFMRETGNDPPGDLFSILDDGTDLISLATTPEDEFFCAHGTRTIVYGRFVGEQSDLHIVDVDGENPHVLAASSFDELATAVAPDGRVIYMLLNPENADLYSVNPDGTGVTPLATSPENETFLAITPQGRVLYSVPEGIGYGIRSIGADGSSPAILADGAWSDATFEGLTPQGDVIFTSYDMLGEGGVYSVSQHGGTVTTLGSSTTESLSVAGITTTGVVLLRSDQNEHADLYGPGMVPLSITASADDEYLTSTSTGRVIFSVIDADEKSALFSINADGTDRVTLATDTTASMTFIAIAPNDCIVYTDGTDLHAVDPNGSNRQTIALNATTARISARNRVIYERFAGNFMYLNAVDLNGANDTPLVDTGASVSFVAWTESGKIVFRREVDDADFFIVNDDGTNLLPIAMTSDSEHFQTIIE